LRTKGTDYLGMLELTLRNIDERPVYVAEQAAKEKLTGLRLTPAGPLWQVTTP